ncbi:MAG: hypothetical protein LBE35_01495 [Clostridiales bacterium]|nr:hypothetical protein [Clostridiales bacterium]
MAKKRIFELAQDLGLDAFELVEMLPSLGVFGKEYASSALTQAEVRQVMTAYFAGESPAPLIAPTEAEKPMKSFRLAPVERSEVRGQRSEKPPKVKAEKPPKVKAEKVAKVKPEKVAKVKPQKEPKVKPPKTGGGRHQRFAIKICSDDVFIVKSTARGRILSLGRAPLEDMPDRRNSEYIDKMTEALKIAAHAAKVPKGSNIPAIVVANDPLIVVNRFTWPEIPTKALMDNARTSIASYLPATAALDDFVISVEVLNRTPASEDSSALIDVIVAAMPHDMAVIISTAVKRAGFKILRLDVAENSRGELVKRYASADFQSFGVLDLTGSRINITLYLHGIFHSMHYCSSGRSEYEEAAPPPLSLEEQAQAELLGLSIEPAEAVLPDESGIDIDSLASEIAFIVDYIDYREKSDIKDLLLVGCGPYPELVNALRINLNLNIWPTQEWIRPEVYSTVKLGNSCLAPYYDAFAAGIPSRLVKERHMINLKTQAIDRRPKMRTAMRAVAATFVMLVVVAGAFFVPWWIQRGYLEEAAAVDLLEARVMAIYEQATSAETLAAMNDRIEQINALIEAINDFHTEFVRPHVLVPEILESGMLVQNLSVSRENVNFSGSVQDFYHLAFFAEHFRNHPLFESASFSMPTDTAALNPDALSVSYTFTLRMIRGLGIR